MKTTDNGIQQVICGFLLTSNNQLDHVQKKQNREKMKEEKKGVVKVNMH